GCGGDRRRAGDMGRLPMMEGRMPRSARLVRSAILLSALLVGGCATPVREVERESARTYAFVVLGEEGQPVARGITAASTCPAIDLDGHSEAMDVRARPATIPLRATRSEPALSKPSIFPVLVCDKAIPRAVARASVLGRALPLPKANPRRIVVVGDTGCRI